MSENELYREIGQRIASARDKKGLTQRQLGTLTGISEKHISIIENGSNMRADTIVEICRVLELDYTYLFTGNPTVEKAPQILSLFTKLNERQYEAVMLNINTFIEDNEKIVKSRNKD